MVVVYVRSLLVFAVVVTSKLISQLTLIDRVARNAIDATAKCTVVVVVFQQLRRRKNKRGWMEGFFASSS